MLRPLCNHHASLGRSVAKCLQFNHYGRILRKTSDSGPPKNLGASSKAPVLPCARKLEMVLIPHRLALLSAQPVTNKLVWDAQESSRRRRCCLPTCSKAHVHEAIDSVLELEALRRKTGTPSSASLLSPTVTAPSEVSHGKCAKLRSTPDSNTMPSLQFVGQLAHVSRPGIGKQTPPPFRGNSLQLHSVPLANPLAEKFG